VPTFIIDGQLLTSGAAPPEILAGAIAQAARKRSA
jgi:predicted DsbA family dithiol-disulfide isomerase